MFETKLKKPIVTTDVYHPNIKIDAINIFNDKVYTDKSYIHELFKEDTTLQHYHIDEKEYIHQINLTRGFSTILLVSDGKSNFICNRNHNSMFKTIYVSRYISWWGLPLGKFYTFFSTSVKVLKVFQGMGNDRHYHQSILNILKKLYIKYNPQYEIKEDEKICDIVIKDSVKDTMNTYKELRKNFIAEYKNMKLSEIKSYCMDLIERFNRIYHSKIPNGHDILMFISDDEKVVIRYKDNPKKIYRYEGLPYAEFCKLVFSNHFSNYDDFIQQIKTNPYYLKCYVVYICCFLRGYKVTSGIYENIQLKEQNNENIA